MRALVLCIATVLCDANASHGVEARNWMFVDLFAPSFKTLTAPVMGMKPLLAPRRDL